MVTPTTGEKGARFGKPAASVGDDHIQQKVDDLDDPCPLWATPTVTLGEKGIALNGRTVVSKDAMPGADRLVKIEPLQNRLSTYRKRWLSFQPRKRFPRGPITL